MPRGANDNSIELAIAHLHGRIESQIQQFSATFGIQADRVAERISDLLSPERTRVLHHMSAVRIEATGVHRELEPVEVAIDAHSGKTPPQLEASTKPRKAHSYWSKMTPEQRSAEMKKRQKKWTKEAKAKWFGTNGNSKNRKTKAYKEHQAKRKMYQARYAARKRGETLPPLPKELASAIQ